MKWVCKCENYEVRGVPEILTSQKGNTYAIMRVENPDGYSAQIMCRRPEVLMNAGLKKGDIIGFDMVANVGNTKYPNVAIPENGSVWLMSSKKKDE